MTDSINPKLNLNELMADIRIAAEIAGAPCQDDVVWAILNAYETYFSEDAVAFRITTKATPELNVRYQTLRPHDPYAIALEHGFLKRVNHPAHDVVTELRAKRPDAGFLIDIGVTHGFEKIWGFFATPLSIEEVCALKSTPQSLRTHLDLFKHYGLNWVSVVGVDYLSHTTNPYFMKGSFPNSPEIAAQMVVDMGFELPSAEDNNFNSGAFVLYPTFTWDSSSVERVSFACVGPQNEVPVHWHPLIKKFAEQVPLRSNPRLFTFNTCYGRDIPNYFKLEADYHGNISKYVIPLIEGGIKAAQQSSN